MQPEAAARAARTARASTRKALEHLQDLTKDDREKLVHKYQSMPDLYYDADEATTPDRLQHLLADRPHDAEPADLYEHCAGSGKLSNMAKHENISHHPPTDYRWGYDLGRFADQI